MTNRALAYIVRDQRPLVLPASTTAREAARAMWERRCGSVLVVDADQKLVGIFTGRDAVRLLARSKNAPAARLDKAMTTDPACIGSNCRAVEALRAMTKGGFRHLPVVEHGRIAGVVSRGDFKGMEFEHYRWHEKTRSDPACNRTLGEIVSKRKSLILSTTDTVATACRRMSKDKHDCVLVADARHRLKGVFTGRDAVRALARHSSPGEVRLAKAMTPDPATMPPDAHAIDALRVMNDGGFRHLPVLAAHEIRGVVARADFTGLEIDRIDEEQHLMECIW